MEPAFEPWGRVLLVGEAALTSGLEALLTPRRWQCTCSESATGVLRRLHEDVDVDLVVLIPGESIPDLVELCRHIKFDRRTSFIAVVFVLSPAHADSRTQVFKCGADDCIMLPAPSEEIVLRLEHALRSKQATDSLEDAKAVISSLANAIEGRDPYTRGHVERVGTYAVEIGRRIGLGADAFAALRVGGVVHDIGKVAVPDHLLNKRGMLTDSEFEIVKRHPLVGYNILKPLRTFRDVLPIVRWHHERPNGTGYPDGLRDEELPLLPRIAAVADVFDAISTDRPYRPARPLDECRMILMEAGDRGDLDKRLVSTFLATLDESLVTPVEPAAAAPPPR